MKDYLRKILPKSIILWSHKLRGILAAMLFRFPGRKLKIIGVTGTNGKTTTCNMIAEILKTANYRVGLATTINFAIDRKEWVNKTKMTTLSPFALQKFLSNCLKAGCHWVVLETTSHAIAQYRNFGIDYKIAVLTNITHDHLDYHKTYEEYRDTKARLFSEGETINILNRDDKSVEFFENLVSRQTITYGTEVPENKRQRKPEILAKKIILEPASSLFTVVTPIGQESLP